MEKSVKNYTFKKRICALLTVLVLFLNMFSPYGVLMNKSYAGSPADDEPYFVMKIHSIDDINTVDEDDWSDDTWEYYWDYSYSKVDTPEESTNHFITMDLIIKGGTNVNTGSISFSFDSTKIIPAYSYNAGSSRNPNWQIETSIDDITDFATINWPTQMLKTYDESSSTIRVDGSSSTYLPDGYVAVTMTFLLADGVTINDLTKDMITLVPATGVSKGLEIDYFPDTINLLYVEGKDYLLFEGFAQGAKSVDSIAFKSEPSKNKYYNTETLDFTGAIITVTYDDGLAEDVTVADAISAGTITVDSMVANNTTKKVTLTYEGETVDFNYYVLDSINISSDLTKMDYEHNDTINFAGGELEATYSNASGSSVKDTINIANGISSGDIIVNRTKADVNNKTITFTYHSLSTDMLLTVTDPVASISITTVPTELTYNDGNTISFAGGQITPVTKSGNTLTPVATDDPSVTVSATTASIASIPESDRWTIAGRDGLQAGNQTITLTYEGKTADLTIVVNDTVSGVSITAQSTEKNKYGTEANALNFTGLVATVTTSGGSSFTVGANSLTIDRSSYNPTSLATQSLPVKYGTIESSNDVEITLSNYITGITTTFTKTEFDYDTPLSTVISNGTYVENYADGTSSSAKAITSDMVTGYVQKPAASLFDSTHKYNEILTIKLTSSSNSFDQLPATDTNTITINDVIDNISVLYKPTKVTYKYGETFSSTGGQINLNYKSGAVSQISMGNINVELTETDGNSINMSPAVSEFTNGVAIKTIKVTYTNNNNTYDTSFDITIKDEIDGVAISTNPKLIFNHGDTFDASTGKLTVNYKSGNTEIIDLSKAKITEIDDSEIDMSPVASSYTSNVLTKQVKVSYGGKETNYNITLQNIVDNIEIGKTAPKTNYSLNDSTIGVGGTLTVTRKAGNTETVNIEDSMVSGLDTSVAGTGKIATVTYKDEFNISASTTYTYDVNDNVTSIDITAPSKTTYKHGEKISTDGTITVHYASGTSSSVTMTESMIKEGSAAVNMSPTSYDSTNKVDKTLTIEYTEGTVTKTINYPITIVNDVRTIGMHSTNHKTKYNVNDTLDVTNAEILVTRAVGTPEVIQVTKDMVSGFNSSVENESLLLTVSYTENGITKTTNYNVSVTDTVTGIALKGTTPSVSKYGEELDLTGVTIEVTKGSGKDTVNVTNSMISGFDKNTLGEQTVTVTYGVDTSGNPVTTTFKVTVQDYVTKIEVNPARITGTYNDELADLITDNNITYTVTYAKAGTKTPISLAESMVTGYSKTETSEQNLIVTYRDNDTASYTNGTDFTDTLTVTLTNTVASISIDAPSKTIYKHGETLDLTGGIINLTYEDTKTGTLPLSNATIEEADGSQVNMSPSATEFGASTTLNKTLVIKYTKDGKTGIVNYPITIINDVRTIGMHSTNHKTKYNVNDTLDVTNAEILVTRAVGTPEVIQVTKDMVSGFNSSVENESLLLTVSYTENGITKTTNYNVSVTDTVTGIALKGTTPSVSKYGEELDLTGVTIEVTKGSGKDTVNVTNSMISGFDKNTLGEQTVTVTYGVDTSGNPVTTTFKVTVQDYVTKIEVNPARITGTYNDELADLITDNNITYTVTYAKAGSKTPISLAESMVTGYSKTETSEQNLIVTYKDNDTASYTNGQDFTETLNVTLINSVKEIAVTAPTKTEYEHGDSLDLSGGNIVVTFLDGTTQNVQLVQSMIKETVTGNAVNMSPAITEYNSNNQLTKELKVEYTQGGKTGTATYNITIVNSVDEISIATSPKTSYKLNEATTDVGGSLTIIRKAGNTETINITDGMVSGLDTTIEMASKTATVTYTEGTVTKTTTYTYSVVDAITGISIKNNPNKTTYGYSDMIDLSGGQITITKESGNTEDKSFTDTNVIVTETDGSEIDLTNVTFGTDNIATKTIKVRYDEKEVTFDILVINKITQIKIKQTPKTSYEIGDSLDLSTGTIEVTRENGNKEEIPLTNSNVIVTGFDSTKENTSLTLTVKYTENGVTKETSYNISVVDVVSDIQISTIPKTSYKYGEALDVAAGKLTVVRSSGPVTIPITPNMVTEVDGTSFDSTRLGTRNLKVTYGGMERTYEITVSDYVTGILLTPPTKVKYEYGESLDLAGGTVQKVMASGTATNKVALTDNAVIISTFDPNKIGAQTIGVTYEGITEKFAVIVEDNIKSITIKNVPTKVTYKYGEALDVTGGKIEATRSSLSKEEIPLTLSMVTGYIPNKLGKQTLTITYNGKTTTYDVTVEDYITDITITKPAKLVYKVNETIDLTGGKVNVIMASGTALSPIAMTNADVTITGFDTSSEGAKTIKVSYKGLTKTFGITVVDQLSGVILKTLPNKTDYLYGESLDLSGATLEIVKESGAKETINVTKEMISGYNSKKLGNQTVTISYEGFTQEFIVNVEDYVSSLKVIAPDKVEYEYGESLDLSGGKVSIVMASGKINETIEMTASMTSGFDKNKIGKQTITVEYKGLKGSFQINLVDKVKAISINTQANKTNYKQGEEIDVTGATITVIKSSGITVIPVTKDMISNYDKNIIGTQLVTISYSGFTTNFIVVVEKQQSQNEEQEKTDNKTNDGGSITPSTTTSTNLNQVTNNNQTTTTNTEVEKPRAEESLSDVEETNANNDKNDDETQKNPQQDTKQTETLGVNDEKEPEEKYNTKLIAGSIGILGLLFLILLICLRRNVKIYVQENGEFVLGGVTKVTKKKLYINVDPYLDGETYANQVKIRLNDTISEKLDGKELEIKHRGKKVIAKVKYEDKPYEIFLE